MTQFFYVCVYQGTPTYRIVWCVQFQTRMELNRYLGSSGWYREVSASCVKRIFGTANWANGDYRLMPCECNLPDKWIRYRP